MANDPEPAVRPWDRRDAPHVVLLLLAAACYVRFLAGVAPSLPPQGDAASHAVAAVGMATRFAAGWSQAAQSMIYAGSSYPTLLYGLSALLFAGHPSATTLPYASYFVLVGSLVLGWFFARGRWGLAPAWTWASIQALSPWVVGYSGHYMLDLPLAATVGVGHLALVRARRFDRVGAGIVLGLLAAAGMLFKWAWLFFLGPAFGLCVLVGLWRGGDSLRARVPGVLAMALATGGVLYAMRWAVTGAPLPTAPDSRLTWPYVYTWYGCVGAGAALVLLGVLVRPLRGIRGLLAACGAAFATAGPWYLLAQRELWARYAWESGVHAGRTQSMEAFVKQNGDVARSFFPGVDALLVLALLAIPFAHPRVRGDVALALVGLLTGFAAVTATLPFDPRYLLPLLPLAAGAIAASSSALPVVGRWALVGVIVPVGLWSVQAQGAAENGPPVRSDVVQRESNPDVTWTVGVAGQRIEVLRVQPALELAGFYASLETIRAECGMVCDVIVQAREDFWIQGRTFEAAGRLAGITGAEWGPLPRADDPHRPSPARAARGINTVLVLQPCSRFSQERGNVDAWRREVEAVVGGRTEPVGAFPMPLGCKMYVDRVRF